jgi:hypothetical protein
MHGFVLAAFVLAVLAAAAPNGQSARVGIADTSQLELLSALRATEVAEIYVIGDIEFPMTPTPQWCVDPDAGMLSIALRPNGRTSSGR